MVFSDAGYFGEIEEEAELLALEEADSVLFTPHASPIRGCERLQQERDAAVLDRQYMQVELEHIREVLLACRPYIEYHTKFSQPCQFGSKSVGKILRDIDDLVG